MSAYHSYTIADTAQPATDFKFNNQSRWLLEDPARTIVHAFNQTSPQLIDAKASIAEALIVLERTHSKTCFVVDANDQMLGIISKARLLSSYVLKYVAKTGIPRQELTVQELMIPKSQLKCMDVNELDSASIKDVLSLLESEGHEHLLIVAQRTKQVVGYADLLDMAKLLERPLSQTKRAKSFSEIVDSLWHHDEI